MKNLLKVMALAFAILLPTQGWAVDTKISGMTAKASPVAADTTVIVDSVGGANKKITLGSIPDLPLSGGTLTGNLTLSPGNLTFTSLGAPASAPTLALVTISGQNVTAGSHKVVITYATATGETPASSASGAVTADGTHTELLVTFNDTPPTGATYRNVYLSKQGTTTPLYYVAQVAVATGTYTINVADGSLPATMPPTVDGTAGGISGGFIPVVLGIGAFGDLGLSRISAGLLGVGNGTQGDYSGGLRLGHIEAFDTSGIRSDFGSIQAGAATYFLSGCAGSVAMNLNSADKYGTIQNDSSDTWSLGYGGTSLTVNLGTPVIQWNTSKQVIVPGVYSQVVTGSPVLVSSAGMLGVASSSEKYKSLIQPLSNTEWIYKLQPKEYYYKWDKDWVKQYGLIAEDVVKIKPEMVFNDKDGKPDRVRYEQLIPWLLKAVQEQQAEIVALQGQVKELKKGK